MRMLKAYLCFFLVLLGHLGLSAQAVKILFAPANMRSAESGKILVADDNLLAEEKITMRNYDASLIVWDELDGLCELKARQVSGKKWKARVCGGVTYGGGQSGHLGHSHSPSGL